MRAQSFAPTRSKHAFASRPALRPARRLVCKAALPAAEPGKTTLGFIGMGIMGVPMTLNLMKAGYEVVVYNRSADKCETPVAAGAKIAATAKECVEMADYTFAMLSDPEAAVAVAMGENGAVAGCSAGKGYVDVSTVDAGSACQIAAAVRSTGASFLEAPVSGSKGPAEQGALIFLTGGDEELFKAVEGPLDVMGKAKFFLGEEGKGAKMKLVVNMIMGAMMTSFAEGMALADGAGLKQEDLLEVISLGAIAAPMFKLKGPSMAEGKYAPAFPLKHQQKDMRLALALGDELSQPLPMAAAANERYIAARAQDLGDMDFSAVLEVLKAAKK